MSQIACRFCSRPLEHLFADLGVSPLANSFVEPENLLGMEPFYPLRAFVCDGCFLVQLPELESPEAIFQEYAYFSSYSESWLRHAAGYAERVIERFGLDAASQVIEIASNDGYLLRNFVERGMPVLGIEPARNVAEAARQAGIPTLVRFFGSELAAELAAEGRYADLLVGNNVLAHVPELNDFVAGLATVLGPAGILTLEFPHLMRLMDENQFDTIYHEHYSYFSFATVRRVLERHRLRLFDVEELPTHGGSLRIYACHAGDSARTEEPAVGELLAREEAAGLGTLEPYLAFQERVRATKRRLLAFLLELKSEGRSIVAYGAAAKGNTLLNYCGIGTDFIDYAVDRSPHKQGRWLPGSRIPIHEPERVSETRPDYLFILPWNLKREIVEQMAEIREWGARFFVAIPSVEVID